MSYLVYCAIPLVVSAVVRLLLVEVAHEGHVSIECLPLENGYIQWHHVPLLDLPIHARPHFQVLALPDVEAIDQFPVLEVAHFQLALGIVHCWPMQYSIPVDPPPHFLALVCFTDGVLVARVCDSLEGVVVMEVGFFDEVLHFPGFEALLAGVNVCDGDSLVLVSDQHLRHQHADQLIPGELGRLNALLQQFPVDLPILGVLV